MKNELQELFHLAAKFFLKKYKEKGGAQSILAQELGITQSYLSSVTNGSRTASLELYSQIAEKLYGPLDKFLAVGRRIKEGKEPLAEDEKKADDSVESLIARLTYYVVDHQRIEKELSDFKKFYETIVENQLTGILVMDKDHNVVYANNHMNTMAHIPVNKIVGTSPYDAEKNIPDLDITGFTEQYDMAFKQRTPVVYKNIKTKMPNGESIFISGSLTPLHKDDMFDGMICSIYDTTSSHILRNLLMLTLDFSEKGIGVVQQIDPGEQPRIYYKNKKFDEIFDFENIDPSQIPFDESVKIMTSRMKNGKQWLDFISKSIISDISDARFIINMKNNKQYQWTGNPLIDDQGNHWGRIALIEEIKKKKK